MAYESNGPSKLVELYNKEIPKRASWVEPGILTKGGTLLFGGAAKIGKTCQSLSMARSLALGVPVFGCPFLTVPEKARVLVVDQELGEVGLQKRVKLVLEDDDPDEWGENLYYIAKNPNIRLDTWLGLQPLVKAIDETRPNVLILDPIGMLHGGNENDFKDVSVIFENLAKIKDKFKNDGLSIIMSHHFGKPVKTPGFTPSWDDLLDPYNFRGSSKWKDGPDTLITSYRMKDHRFKDLPPESRNRFWDLRTRIIVRQDEPMNDMKLSVNEDKRLGVKYLMTYSDDAEGRDSGEKGKLPGLKIIPGKDGKAKIE